MIWHVWTFPCEYNPCTFLNEHNIISIDVLWLYTCYMSVTRHIVSRNCVLKNNDYLWRCAKMYLVFYVDTVVLFSFIKLITCCATGRGTDLLWDIIIYYTAVSKCSRLFNEKLYFFDHIIPQRFILFQLVIERLLYHISYSVVWALSWSFLKHIFTHWD